MKVIVALGGNALLRRGEPMTSENQRENVKRAAASIAKLVTSGHQVTVTHGNGPQIGLLALQAAAYDADSAFPLDLLGAETEGMIGYLIEQELENALGQGHKVATLLTQVEVDARDPAFNNPTKPVGPVYEEAEARRLAQDRGWAVKADGAKFRRVVPSPEPKHIPDTAIIRLLLDHDVTVICAGGGGIPVVRRRDGSLIGVEAVIDKDAASSLLASDIETDALLMLTDVDRVYLNWDTPEQKGLGKVSPAELQQHEFAAGSMQPKVDAACRFVMQTGGIAGIGRLEDAADILEGRAGTLVSRS
ncbi:MAG: carbamate kinase [Pseudomonadota bacterium]